MEGTTELLPRPLRPQISGWAIVAGLIVALATQLILLLLGAAIGLTTFQASATAARGAGIGAAVWLVVTLCISAFVGSLIASSVGHITNARRGGEQAVVLWAILTLIGLYVVGGTLFGAAAGVASAVGSAAPAVSQQLSRNPDQMRTPFNRRMDEARDLLNNPTELRSLAQHGAAGAALGLWGLLVAILLPLGAALLGSAAGWRGELRFDQRQGRRRQQLGHEPTFVPPSTGEHAPA